MSNLIIKTISALLQTIMTLYSAKIMVSNINNIEKKNVKFILYFLLTFIGILIPAFVTFPNFILRTLTCAIPMFISLTLILKINKSKAVLITITTFILFALTEVISMLILYAIFKCDTNSIINDIRLFAIFTFIQNLLLLLIIKITTLIIDKNKNNKDIADSVNSSQIINVTILICIFLLPIIFTTVSNTYSFDIKYLIIYTLEIIFMTISLFLFFKRTVERDKVQSELFISETHNKTMIGMVDGVRTLKHDYNNIMQALNGYVVTKQYDKLEEHIKKVLQECNVVNNLSIITPELFNEPAIYGVMGAKYFLAIEKDIPVDIEVICDFTKISFSMPDLSRILGILLDNAMEATIKSKEPYIKFEAIFDKRKNADVIKVMNTYDTSINIDLEKIYEKGISSKKIKSGIGLWEVKKIVKKNKNAQIFPTIEKDKFVQNIIIERLFEYDEPDKEEGALIVKNND